LRVDVNAVDGLAGRAVELYFKVYDAAGTSLLANTLGDQTWKLLDPPGETVIYTGTSISGSQTFVVYGRVLDAETGPASGKAIEVFDVIIENSEELSLGSDTTDANGHYRVTYAPSDLIGTREHGDLQIRVASPATRSSVRCNAPPACRIDVVINGSEYLGPTAHATLFGRIEERLGDVGPSLLAISDEAKIAELACSVDREVAEVRALWRAYQIDDEQPTVELDPEILFGLMRQGLPDDRKGLLSVSRPQLRVALDHAITERHIRGLDTAAFAEALDDLRDAVVELAKEAAASGTTCNLNQVLTLSVSSQSDRDVFLEKYAEHEDDILAFWTAIVGASAGLTAPVVADTQLVLQWGALSRYYLPLLTFLNTNKATYPTFKHLAALDHDAWYDILKPTGDDVGAPDDMPGSGDDKLHNYADLLERTMEAALPTAAIAGRIKAAAPTSDRTKFFDNNPSFDLREHRVAAFFAGANLTGVADQTTLLRDLKRIERLYKFVPRYAEMTVLLDDGLHSARAVQRYGRTRFVTKYAAALGGEQSAKRAYDQATLQAAAASQLFLWFNPRANGPMSRFLPKFKGKDPGTTAGTIVADWETLFGSLDICACEHCSSLVSPAAYLTDLLGWLGRFDSNVNDSTEPSYLWTARELLIGGDHTALTPAGEAIAGRRPDIGRILLNCKNAFTTLPYIDLVLELLERRVSGAPLPASIETTHTAEELLSAPEYIDHAAYDTLSTSFYPWRLPYSPYQHEARVYLEHLGISRPELMEGLERSFRPIDVSGCKLWLRADLGVRRDEAGGVVEWLDLSGNANDAYQNDAAHRPTRSSLGAGRQACIEFAGAIKQWLMIADSSSLDVATAATVVVVGSNMLANDGVVLVKGQIGSSFNYGLSRTTAGNATAWYTNTTRTGPAWPASGDAAAACIVELAADHSAWRINGTETLQSGQTNTITQSDFRLVIGARPANSFSFDFPLTGRIYEILLFDHALTAGEEADLEAYLFDRYDIAPASARRTPSALQIAQERIGLTKLEREVIVGGVGIDPWLLWGFSSSVESGTDWFDYLTGVSKFLRRADFIGSLDFWDQFREFLDSGFVNAWAASGQTVHIEPPESCNPEILTIAGLDAARLEDAWKAIQGFLRLRRRLAWTIRDLDKLVTALADLLVDDALTDAFIEALGDVLWLRERFPRVSVPELASWWSALDVRDTPSHQEPSFYARVFLDRAIANPPPADFVNFTGTIASNLAHVLAATRMAAADFALLTSSWDARARVRLQAQAPDTNLTLESLSNLYRIASLARAMKRKIADVVVLRRLAGLRPLKEGSTMSSPAETRRFVAISDRLSSAGLSVPEAHYLVRHVTRSSEGVSVEDEAVAARLAALDKGLGAIVAATTYVEDPTGTNLRALLTKILASEIPGLASEHLTRDVDLVVGIVTGSELFDGASALSDIDRKNHLERILGPYVGDIAAIQNELLFRPYSLASCKLWLEPAGIQSTDDVFTGWSSLAAGATVSIPGQSEPRFIAAGPFGLPAVQLDGEDDDLAITLSSYSGNDHSLFFVVRQNVREASSGMALFEAETGALVCAATAVGGSEPSIGLLSGSTSVAHQPNATGDQILSWIFNATADTCAIYRDGAELGGSAAYATNVTLGGALGLGGRFASSVDTFDGMIACAGVFQGALTTELGQVHDYLFTMARKPPIRRFEIVEKDLLDFWRLREARNFIKDSLSSELGVTPAAGAALLDSYLHSVVNAEPLIEDLLVETHAAPRPTTRQERLRAVARFSKAATIVQKLAITEGELAWLYGPYRDPGWLDFNDLPLAIDGLSAFDASRAAIVEGELELPGWLTITCPTAERSSQSGASSVRIGLGPNAARAFSRDGESWALLVEPARTNKVDQQDWLLWTQSGPPVIGSALTPASVTAAVEVFDDSVSSGESISRSVSGLVVGPAYSLSGWTQLLPPLPSPTTTLVWLNASSPNLQFVTRAVEPAWSYHSSPPTAAGTTGGLLQLIPRSGGVTATGATRFWGIQVEQGSYPTSFIGADNLTFSRSADTLSIDSSQIAALDTSVFFIFSLRYAPLYTHGETTIDHDLLFLDSTRRIFFRQSDKKIVATWGTTSVTSDALTFPRDRELSITFVHGPGPSGQSARVLMVSGAASGNGTWVANGTAPSVSWPTLYLLGNASGAQEGAALASVSFDAIDPESDMPRAIASLEALLLLADTTALRSRLRRRGTSLFELFARTVAPGALDFTGYLDRLSAESGYSRDDLQALGILHRLSYPADYRNEVGLAKIINGLDIAGRLGVSAITAATWFDVDGDTTAPKDVGAATLRAARAKHAASEWPEIGRALREPLREAQRDALVAYLLHAEDKPSSSELYDDLLVDPEMSACGLTSRIALAISSVQLYVHRILLGLEETQLDRDAREEWEWRKMYRVWEANRKVLIWPENWIFPDLRDDKTPLFERLESKLRQGEITDALCEEAYGEYLRGLDEIAQLHIAGMVHHREDATEELRELDELHVFGRSFGGTPYTLYHRKWVDREYWTPWVEVPVEAASRVYLPVIEHGRLNLHWLQLTKNQQTITAHLKTSQLYGDVWTKPHTMDQQPVHLTAPELALPVHEYVLDGDHSAIALHRQDQETGINPFDPESPPPTFVFPSLVGRWKIDACRGLTETFQRISVPFSGIYIPRPKNALFWNGAFTITDPGNVVLSLGTGDAWVLAPDATTRVQVERKHRRNSSLTSEFFVPIDMFFVQVGARRLLGVFEPFLSQKPSRTNPPVGELGDASTIEVISNYVTDDPDNDRYFSSTTAAVHSANITHSLRMVVPDLRPKVHFQSFWHPYVCKVLEVLNRHGVSGLRDYFRLVQAPSDKPLQEIEEEYFEAWLPPSPHDSRILEPYPKDDFDLEYRGAYAGYNWELFFHIPFILATWLKDNRRFKEARDWLHAIFNPGDGDIEELSDVWRFRRFRELPDVEGLQDDVISGSPSSDLAKWLNKALGGAVSATTDTTFEQQIAAWEDDPFNPHRLARMRPVAYMKATVKLYIELLIAWGDDLFRQDTVETIVEAQQLYILALKTLGDRPIFIEPASPPIEPRTFLELEEDLDILGNALIELEGAVPIVKKKRNFKKPALPDLEVAYFCVPQNEKLLELWDIVDDRLFKIRHCMNIEGVVRELPLFQPPIDPGLLVKAKAAGLDLASVLADLYAPPPLHRYPLLQQRAVDFTSYVVSLGQSLLSALEKEDAEQLAALRANHEVDLLELVRETRAAQVKEAEEGLEATRRSQALAALRRDHYRALLDKGTSDLENAALDQAREAASTQELASGMQIGGQILHLIPSFTVFISGPNGPASSVELGGPYLGRSSDVVAAATAMGAARLREQASETTTMAGYARRAEDWQLQLGLAEAEHTQIDKQIVAAEIRADIAKKELASHERQIEQSKEVRDFLEDKYTNQELYTWMKGELQTTYYQAYKLAFDMARRAERAWQFERLEPDTRFIEFGYWDSARKGLLAGEKLMLGLRRMEAAHLEKDRRDYEIQKSISLAEQEPLALLRLRETGSVIVELPEALFDRDYPGHFFRRIKSVSLTLPAVTGPHTSVNCTLTLLSSKIRFKGTVGGGYLEEPNSEDERFRYTFNQVARVCTSRGLNDAGMFELSFKDERLLPFEGAGAISRWRIDLPQETNRFDLSSLTDVILQLSYTAREGGGVLGEAARKEALKGVIPEAKRLINVKHELKAAWTAFEKLNGSNNQVLTVEFGKKMPFVPGVGPTELVRLYAALEIDHPDAGTIELEVSLNPPGADDPVELSDAAVAVTLVDYESDPVDVATTLTLTVTQTTIAALPLELTEETTSGSGIYRLKSSVFKNLWLLAEIRREPPIV
jgi:hypothetical protein